MGSISKSVVPLWQKRRHTKKKELGSRLGDFLGSAEGGHFCPSPLHLRTLLDKMGIFNKHRRKNIVYLLRFFTEIYGRELNRTQFLAANFLQIIQSIYLCGREGR
jgi:hypothetical protein